MKHTAHSGPSSFYKRSQLVCFSFKAIGHLPPVRREHSYWSSIGSLAFALPSLPVFSFVNTLFALPGTFGVTFMPAPAFILAAANSLKKGSTFFRALVLFFAPYSCFELEAIFMVTFELCFHIRSSLFYLFRGNYLRKEILAGHCNFAALVFITIEGWHTIGVWGQKEGWLMA